MSRIGTKMEHNAVIEFIKTLVRASKNGNCIEEKGEKIHNTSYLLNQTLRQYGLKQEHYFISEKAILLWERLTSEEIMSRYYQDKVKCDRANGIIVREYIGNSKQSNERLIAKDDVITYRSVFHDEHIVPINIIQQELNDLVTLDDESVKAVLGKIRICRMLKEEDKETVNKRNRSSDYREAIADNYTPKGIVCINVVTKERI